jgi:hypothetical protein
MWHIGWRSELHTKFWSGYLMVRFHTYPNTEFESPRKTTKTCEIWVSHSSGMKLNILWDMSLCTAVDRYQRFGGTASELYLLSDRCLLAKSVPTFADRGCCMVSITDHHGHILRFIYQKCYYFFQVAPQLYSQG